MKSRSPTSVFPNKTYVKEPKGINNIARILFFKDVLSKVIATYIERAMSKRAR